MNTYSKIDKFTSYGILAWLILLIIGPYMNIGKLPLRLDHFIFPTIGTFLLVYLSVKERFFPVPKILIFHLLFLSVAAIATITALLSKENLFIKLIPFIADLDNHLRVVLIFLLIYVITRKVNINYCLIIKGLLVISIIPGFISFFQVSEVIPFIHDFVEKLSIDWYSGRSDRGISMPKILMHLRAVSTFYLPGNNALFSSMMLTFLLAARKYLKLNIILYYIILLALVIGLFFSGSKGFFTGTIIIFSYLIFKTKWREILEFLLILSLVFFLAKSYTNTLIRYYESYFKNTTIITFYNKTLGKRYGEFYEKTEENIKEIENFRKMKLMNSQKEATKENNSNSLGIKETTQAKEKTSEVLPKEKEIKIDGKDYRFNFEDGNLSDALKVVYSHFLIGVGFVSNVNYGDSMVVHLLVRGGIIGICFYLGFLFVISRELYKTSFTDAQSKAFSEAWIVVCIIFLTGGLAYPSFVQDRTGDIFWWLAAILAMKQPSARPSFS